MRDRVDALDWAALAAEVNAAGSGQYRYFDHPLPDVVADLRAAFYPHLLPIAREWAERLDRPAPWPDTLEEDQEQPHRDAAQRRSPVQRSHPVSEGRGSVCDRRREFCLLPCESQPITRAEATGLRVDRRLAGGTAAHRARLFLALCGAR